MTGFAASADANVSFDGETVLFAGKRSAGDPWQIWELALNDHSVRQGDGHGDGCGASLLSAGRADGLGTADASGIPIAVRRRWASDSPSS